MKKITIAIDGHSSCGKSTMAKDLARRIGYVYIDTGAMYRAVTLFAMRHNLIANGQVDAAKLQEEMGNIHISLRLNPETQRPDTYLNGECVEREIRTMEVSRHVSLIAALPFVRSAMVEMQREMGKEKGVVMDGRDIGTSVFPNADLKIFMVADDKVRAERRLKEMESAGKAPDFETVLANLKERDYIDSHRKVSPLRQADDAIVLDNTHMTMADQMVWIKDIVNKKFGE